MKTKSQILDENSPIKVSPNKIIDFLLRQGMKILELVESGEFFNIEAIGSDDVGRPFEKMCGLHPCDVRHRREGVGEVTRGPLHAVPVIDASTASFFVYVKLEECTETSR